MNKATRRSSMGIVSSLLLVLAVGQAHALRVLSFDAQNPDRHEVSGGLGFSLTQAGSNVASGLDLSQFDFIYVDQPYEEFLLGPLGPAQDDLKEFTANGGGLVFGSYDPGLALNLDLSGGILPTLPFPAAVKDADLSSLDPSREVAAVPEPGTLALFGLGAAGLLLYRRRMKSRA